MVDAHTLKCLKWIRSKGSVTAEMLVEWDLRHGGVLFEWDDPNAAHEYRLHQARVFLNRFRCILDGYRIRSFIKIPENQAQGIPADAYYTVQEISTTPAMREFVIGDLERRMVKQAMELRMWKLSDKERRGLLKRVESALYGET